MDDQRLVQAMRGKGWAHVLWLMAEGVREDAATCEGEDWPETASALHDWADRLSGYSDGIRSQIHRAEDADKLAGCD